MAQYFWGFIFAPIFEILAENTVENSKDDLIKAIKNGRIWYENGAFKTKGRFSNAISQTLEKMGARHLRGAYFIEQKNIPVELLNAINLTKIATVNKTTKISDFLKGLAPALEAITVRDFIEVTVQKMYKKLELDILKSAEERKLPVIELGIVSPDVKLSKGKQQDIKKYWTERDAIAQKLRENIKKARTKEAKQMASERLRKHQIETYANAPTLGVTVDEYELNNISKKVAEDYVYNMNYWVKKWEVKEIIQMRKDVADMVQKGYRVPDLYDYFRKKWKQGKTKAMFLAENESRLAGSVIQATQYQKLGCTKFMWGKSTSVEKRELHKKLAQENHNEYGINGTNIFEFSNPPIIDDKLGIRGLPRQIWNCKCQMIGIPPTLDEVIRKAESVRNAKRNIFEYVKYKVENSKQRYNNPWRYRRYRQGQTLQSQIYQGWLGKD